MEMTLEQKNEIEEITANLACPKGFVCYKSGFENLPKTYVFQVAELVECLSKNAKHCHFSFTLGHGVFCKCPLRLYIANNFHI